MGKAFFTGWALWEKMVFVLACAMVVTILAGCVKLWYTHWRVKKYAALPPQPIDLMREKSIIRSLSRRSAKTPVAERKRLRSDGVEVPFGIRAIESGIEVDGVWISRNNTPAPSTRQSSANSLWAALPQNSTTDLSSPETHGNSGYHTVSNPSSSGTSRNFDRSFSADTVSSEPSSPGLVAQPARAKYPPHSYMRYENNKHFRNSLTRDNSKTRPTSGHFEQESNGSRSASDGSTGSGTSRKSSNENSELPVQGSPFYHDPQTPNPRIARSHSTSNLDLDMLQTHRLSHVAETGQLFPRARKPGHSGEWASMANFAPVMSGEILNFSLPSTSRPTTPTQLCPSGSSSSNPFATPASAVPSQGYASPPRSSDESSMLQARRTSFNFSHERSGSCVLREVNSGFAILRPGTLDAQALRNPADRSSRSSVDSSSEKRQSRKLQKKRRPSASSRESSIGRKLDTTKFSFDQNGPSRAELSRGEQMNTAAPYNLAGAAGSMSERDMAKGGEAEVGDGKHKA